MNCRNCSAALHGRFCAVCGQKNDIARPTVGHLLSETVESLTHADSRLWRTLWLLLSRPGFLTAEFFAGRRERYLPPVRLYIVLSVVFFLLLTLTATPPVEVRDGVPLDADCAQLQYRGPLDSLALPMLQEACVRLQQGGTRDIADNFLRNMPKAMFVLLPLVAALMLVFYWRPRRLYVEHLLYLVHNHSAIFASLTLLNLVALLPGGDGDLPSTLVVVYLLWYCFRGMRVYYGDSRRLTLAKFCALGVLYLCVAAALLAFTGVASLLEG